MDAHENGAEDTKARVKTRTLRSQKTSFLFDEEVPRPVESSTRYRVEEGRVEVVDSMTYTLPWLRGWSVFLMARNTVFQNRAVWSIMLRLVISGVLSGVLSITLIADPRKLDPSKFAALTDCLGFFTGLVLTFFLKSSIGRWLHCVNSYLAIFDSIRNLAMQLHALGAPRERMDTCLRYGMLSTVFIVSDVQTNCLTPENKRAEEELMWNNLEENPSEFLKVLPGEREAIAPVGDKPWQMWLWIGSLLGRMAQDGDIPGMASPTYGRIMQLAQAAQDHIRELRSTVLVQLPFIYVHMLCICVHVTCILEFIGAGVAVGVSSHGIYKAVRYGRYRQYLPRRS
jgi:hypothetical protein